MISVSRRFIPASILNLVNLGFEPSFVNGCERTRREYQQLHLDGVNRSAHVELTPGRTCSGRADNSTRVCFADPKYVWGGASLPSDERAELAKTHFFASLPSHLVQKMKHARFELGQSDTPEGTWVVGELGEFFQYQLHGVHKVISGYSAVFECSDDSISHLRDFSTQIGESAREAVSASTRSAAGSKDKVVFTGELVDCDTAAIYLHKNRESLLITSNHEGF